MTILFRALDISSLQIVWNTRKVIYKKFLAVSECIF